MDGYVFSLSEEVHIDLMQNKLIELVGLWELVSGPNKRKFYNQYGQIASLITVEVDEPLVRAAINFGTLHKDVSPSTGKIWCLRKKSTPC